MTTLTDNTPHMNRPENGLALPVTVRSLSDDHHEIVDANGVSVDAFGWMQDHVAHVINTSSDPRVESLVSRPVTVHGKNEWHLIDAGGNYIDENLEAARLVAELVNSYGGL